ncbi:transposase [Methylocaldum szegediense]|uniref:Transposase n=1 Tax=Methylocaldum szegediense TaxID=73780 RepID=A0ABM9HWD9_9GAMM|nr:transposase [Methylocaldum szegediense]
MNTETVGATHGGTGRGAAPECRVRTNHARKNELKPWLRKQWVIPPEANVEFVCAMEGPPGSLCPPLRSFAAPGLPGRVQIVLVMDNLNTHKLASLYQAFPPDEPRRLIARLEIHHTPKHGSWLNMAEIELSALASQCLDRCIADLDTRTREVAAWQNSRNAASDTVNWRFTTGDARIKLQRLYPSIQRG